MTKPSLPELLHAAVTAVGGMERPGQVAMAEAVEAAIDDGSHLLVQAGTGTGKSLGYLVPALAHGERVVVATATLALQRQLVERDLPRTVDALHPLLRRRPEFAMLKGRSNYLCLHRLHEGVPQDEEEGLFDQFEAAAPTSKLGQDLLRVRDWADETETGDRDDLTPGISDRAWSQVSVSSRECLGATKCAYGAECFAEMARERAKLAEVIVTNHALLAIDAIEGAPVLPQHEVLIVDEAHELVSRVTGVATGELTPGQVNRAVRRAAKLVNEKAADQLPGQREDVLDGLLGEDGSTGGDPADQRHVRRGGLAGGVGGGHRGGLVGAADLVGARAVRVAAQEALALQCHQLVCDRGGAGQADRLADLPHRRRVAAPLDGVPDDLDHTALAIGEPRAVRPDAWRSARQGALVPLGIRGFVHRMHRLESALGAVLGSDGTVCGGGHVGPSRWSPCCTTVVAFERLRQTHVRVKIRDSAVAILCPGVWLTRCRAGKCAHCCTLHRRGSALVGWAPVCHPAPRRPGTGPRSRRSATASPCDGHAISPYAGTAPPSVPHRLHGRARTGPSPTRDLGCMYGPIPTSSGWMTTAAQKLWSPGSSTPQRSPMLGAASRGP
ncbi:3'-5' exonuclease DinG [Streptomyces glaucescens]